MFISSKSDRGQDLLLSLSRTILITTNLCPNWTNLGGNKTDLSVVTVIQHRSQYNYTGNVSVTFDKNACLTLRKM